MDFLQSTDTIQNSSIKCQKHNKEILYVCCQNEWHCEGLCMDCVPDHTQVHQKNNSKFNLLNIEEAIQKSQTQLSNASIKLAEFQQSIQERIDLKDIINDQNLMNLRQWKQQVQQSIEQKFQEIEEWYIHIYKRLDEYKQQKYEQINQSLQQEQQKTMENLAQITQQQETEVNKFLQPIKYAMTKNIEKKLDYMQQQQQQTDELQVEYKLQFNDKIYSKIQDQLESLINRQELQQQQKQKQQKEKQQQDEKNNTFRKPFKVPKKPRCSECQSEMTYLSELKKHLTCPNKCQNSGKVRNYSSKDISNIKNKGSKINSFSNNRF